MSGKAASFLLTGLLLQLLTVSSVLRAQPGDFQRSLEGGLSSKCPASEQYSSQRPDPQGTATPVSIAVSYNDILDISDADQTFTVDAWLVLNWRDPRLADPSRGESQAFCEVEPGKIWIPRIQIRDLRSSDFPYPEVMLIDAEGKVTLFRRGLVTVFSRFYLRDFPFDRQVLSLVIESLYGIQDVEFHIWDEPVDIEEPTVAGWRLGEPDASVSVEQAKLATRSVFQVTVQADREPGYFTRKLITPVALIVFMAYAIFWISPLQIAPQTGIGATSMLTLIAYQFALSGSLPRISYLTRADSFLLWSLVLVFAALAEAIATAALMNFGKEAVVRKMDYVFRFLYPLAFVLILALAVF